MDYQRIGFDGRSIEAVVKYWISYNAFEAVVKYVGGFLISRRVFCWLSFAFLMFLDKQLRRKHPFKHAN